MSNKLMILFMGNVQETTIDAAIDATSLKGTMKITITVIG